MSDGFHQIVSEKLEKNNFQVWKFKPSNFLMGEEVCPFIGGDQQEPILGVAPTIVDLKTLK